MWNIIHRTFDDIIWKILDFLKNFNYKYYKRSKGSVMKLLLFIMLLLSLAISSYAYDFNLIEERANIVSVEELCKSEFFKELKNVPKDKMNDFIFENWDSNKIVEFKKGTRLPLKIFLKGEFFHLITEDYHTMIFIKKDLFIRIKDKKFLFSDDLKSWKEGSLFFIGNTNISIASKKGSPQIIVGTKLNKRKPAA